MVNKNKQFSTAVSEVLRFLSPRTRDIIIRRFGLKGKKPMTLEAIGREYRITRERVRQIESDALRQLSKPEIVSILERCYSHIHDHFKNHGQVIAEKSLLSNLADPKEHNFIVFILTLSKDFFKFNENKNYHSLWYGNDNSWQAAQKIINTLIDELNSIGKPISSDKILAIARKIANSHIEKVSDKILHSYIGISKKISKNAFGEYGLKSWRDILPKGVKDKAYLVLKRHNKPLHFREVAEAINKVGFDKRTAHYQTVHNELIKDDRFVLVGRGLYALREWGYEPGTVSDVMVSILKQSKNPLSFEEIAKKILEKRIVKENTIFLNLQNKKLFKKTEEGKYLLN